MDGVWSSITGIGEILQMIPPIISVVLELEAETALHTSTIIIWTVYITNPAVTTTPTTMIDRCFARCEGLEFTWNVIW